MPLLWISQLNCREEAHAPQTKQAQDSQADPCALPAQTCQCIHGFSEQKYANGTLQCQPQKQVNWLAIFLPICLGVTCLVVCGAALHVWCTRHHAFGKVGQAAKHKGPPGESSIDCMQCLSACLSTEGVTRQC